MAVFLPRLFWGSRWSCCRHSRYCGKGRKSYKKYLHDDDPLDENKRREKKVFCLEMGENQILRARSLAFPVYPSVCSDGEPREGSRRTRPAAAEMSTKPKKHVANREIGTRARIKAQEL